MRRLELICHTSYEKMRASLFGSSDNDADGESQTVAQTDTARLFHLFLLHHPHLYSALLHQRSLAQSHESCAFVALLCFLIMCVSHVLMQQSEEGDCV